MPNKAKVAGDVHLIDLSCIGWHKGENRVRKVIEFFISFPMPGKSWNLSKGHGKSWQSNMFSENKKAKTQKEMEKNNRGVSTNKNKHAF